MANPSKPAQQKLQPKHEIEGDHRPCLDALLDETDVSRITGLSLASVRRWRLLRQGPKFIKIGAAVRYRREDIAAWLASRPTGGGQETGAR